MVTDELAELTREYTETKQIIWLRSRAEVRRFLKRSTDYTDAVESA